jgi:hypothetical protein
MASIPVYVIPNRQTAIRGYERAKNISFPETYQLTENVNLIKVTGYGEKETLQN